MKPEQKKIWQVRVKKLALSYETGWEYLPESEEAGSVLTDIFLEMELENHRRLAKIWEKQEREFLQVVPPGEEEPRRLETALWVKAGEDGDRQWLNRDTRAYTVTEQGELIYFGTVSPLCLSAARLQWIIRRRGLSAWLCYQEGDGFPVSLSENDGRVLDHPVFRWYFPGLCDGHGSFLFSVEFQAAKDYQAAQGLEKGPGGSWSISDGRNNYPGVWQQEGGSFSLKGECPEFAGNLEGGDYELKLELPAGEALSAEWVRALTGEIVLREEAAELASELCLADTGPCGSDSVLPFGREPETGSCFYLACDRAAAGAGGKLVLQFAEEYETEEKGPEPEGKQEQYHKLYGKLYKKYPWLERTEPIRDWRAEETVWEYYDGKLWRLLPGSEDWNTGCHPREPGERQYSVAVPEDISPCSMEGEEHIYLRLRVSRARDAYAAFYRKQIPVLRAIRFRVEERRFLPKRRQIPDFHQAAEEKVCFGFDREVLPDHRWYTGRECLAFRPEQIRGPGELFGRRACWVEVPDPGEELAAFLPNYVTVRQEAEEGEGADPRQIPAQTRFCVETGKLGVLDALSVADARYDRAGAPIRDELKAAEHYFAHFGRLLTVLDLELMLEERYPFFKVKDCSFVPERRELAVKLEMLPYKEAEAFAREEGRLQEVSEWLGSVLQKAGPLWLQGAGVNCSLCGEEDGGQPPERSGAGLRD